MYKWNPIVLILIGVNDDNRAQNRAQSRAHRCAQKYAKRWLSQACGRCRYAKKNTGAWAPVFL